VPLEITSREQEGIQVVDLRGSLIFGQDDLDFRNQLDRMVQARKIRVVVNLKDITHLDATGLATLEFAAAELQNAGGGLALVNLKPSHIETCIEANLGTTFRIFNDDEDAIGSFFPGREVKHYDILEFIQSREKKPL
jgi:anti-sigma B factor antagonist